MAKKKAVDHRLAELQAGADVIMVAVRELTAVLETLPFENRCRSMASARLMEFQFWCREGLSRHIYADPSPETDV